MAFVMAKVREVNDASFDDEVLRSDIPVITVFCGDWSRLCAELAPVLDEIAEEHEYKLKVVSVDVDENVQTLIRFNVEAIPTAIVFVRGEPVDRIIGAMTKDMLVSRVMPYLGM